ncbi:MAG: M1 family metallopeptidase [Acidobacteria bacterium]|nr:M1 family metallopeptidase [Acidobacteriota bacterium]
MRLPAVLLIVSLLGLAPLAVDARQDTPRPDRNANYTLSARLDPQARTITGVGRLEWRNRTAHPASELRFHLYWNAWRDNHSTWMRGVALAGDTGLASRPESDRAAIDLTTLRVVEAGGGTPTDLLPRVAFIAPDDGNTRDRTLVRVALDQPVAPGGAVTIDFAWTARVPRPFARTGAIGSDFVIAHWFPKIGVLEDDGWRASQFHAQTEFFADFGTYDVSLTVPSGWIVGATGLESSREVHDNATTTHRYRAQDVHDFAWAASPEFIEHRTRFEEPGLPPVDLRLLLRPEHATQAERHVTAAREALKYLGHQIGPFPWPNLTIVDPVALVNTRAQGESTGGMEYPTFIMAGTSWSGRWADFSLEDVIVHEITHQYFQSAVANDEVRHAWLDEGITTWVGDEILATVWPGRFVTVDRYFGGIVTWRQTDVPWSRVHLGHFLDTYRRTPGWDAPVAPTWRQSPRTWAHTNYLRAPLALETLRRTVGTGTMTTVLATFAARGRFRHPLPDEFTAALSEAAGRDMARFVDATLGSADTFDYAVEDVIHRDITPGTVESTVLLRRLEPGVFPVTVRITFDDGREIVEAWDGAETWRELKYEDKARVSRVEVDPDRVLALDVHRTNNSWTAAPRATDAANRWTRRWITWMQHVLLTYAFFI